MSKHEVWCGPAGARRAHSRRGRLCLLRHDRRGAVLIVVAIAAMALVSIVALVVDVGMLLLAHREAQRAADSGALAGASAFLAWDPLGPQASVAEDSAYARAGDYATRHTMLHLPIENGEVATQVVLDSERVRVTVRRPAIPLVFARLFGVNTAGVSATAVAEAVDAGAAKCVKPFALPDMWNEAPDTLQDLNGDHLWDLSCNLSKCADMEHWSFDPALDDLGQRDTYTDRTDSATATGFGSPARNYYSDGSGNTYTNDLGRQFALKVQGGDSKFVPSFWFPWRMPGNAGARDYTDAIKTCQSVQLGDTLEADSTWIEAEKGNMGMPTYKAVQDLISQSAHPDAQWVWDSNGGHIEDPGGAQWDPGDTPDARIFVVAIFDPNYFITSNSKQMLFVEFAKFFLEDPDVLYPGMKQKAPITARYLGRAAGEAGPIKGTITKRIRLIG